MENSTRTWEHNEWKNVWSQKRDVCCCLGILYSEDESQMGTPVPFIFDTVGVALAACLQQHTLPLPFKRQNFHFLHSSWSI